MTVSRFGFPTALLLLGAPGAAMAQVAEGAEQGAGVVEVRGFDCGLQGATETFVFVRPPQQQMFQLVGEPEATVNAGDRSLTVTIGDRTLQFTDDRVTALEAGQVEAGVCMDRSRQISDMVEMLASIQGEIQLVDPDQLHIIDNLEASLTDQERIIETASIRLAEQEARVVAAREANASLGARIEEVEIQLEEAQSRGAAAEAAAEQVGVQLATANAEAAEQIATRDRRINELESEVGDLEDSVRLLVTNRTMLDAGISPRALSEALRPGGFEAETLIAALPAAGLSGVQVQALTSAIRTIEDAEYDDSEEEEAIRSGLQERLAEIFVGAAMEQGAVFTDAVSEIGALERTVMEQKRTIAEMSRERAELQRRGQAYRAELERRLAATVLDREAAETEVAASLAREANVAAELERSEADRAEMERRLATAVLAREALAAERDAAAVEASEAAAGRASLEERLAELILAQAELQDEAALIKAERDDFAARLAAALAALDMAESGSEGLEAQREVQLLNEQVSQLRNQVSSLQSLLNLAEEADREAGVQVEALGAQLNTALARAAQAERRSREAEEQARRLAEMEAAWLAAEAEHVEQYRSNLFGEMRDLLEGRDDVQIVGDRFVFPSEGLFNPGSANLSAGGQQQISAVVRLLLDVADDIPAEVDWVIRVDGHTDNVPLSGGGQYEDNWELSQARALSVVRYMETALDFPPERLLAAAFGEHRPLIAADTPAARAANRRIELKLTER